LKNIWLMDDEELDVLINIMLDHTKLAKEAVTTTNAQRRLEILDEIKKLEEARIEILGR